MASVAQLLTAAEFGNLPDPGHPQELVRGVIVDMPPPKSRHGQICGNIYFHVRNFTETRQLGHVLSNDSGVITERDPDTVRGADVCFYNYFKVPVGPLPNRYLEVPPDFVFEVLSPSDRGPETHRKVAEYLKAGVLGVYVFDPDTNRIHSYFQDAPDEVLNLEDELVGVGSLSGLRISVSAIFS